jgi:hypothetical protein
MKKNKDPNNSWAPFLVAIPMSLWGVIATTFVKLGAQSEATWLTTLGYIGVVMGLIVACGVSYHVGIYKESQKAQPVN